MSSGETCHEYQHQLMLDRLLALNHERYAEEVAAGLHQKKKGKSRKRKKKEDDKQ